MIDATLIALERAMDMRMKAHEIHTSNVANANVPNYKAKDIDFESKLQQVIGDLQENVKQEEPMLSRETRAGRSLTEIDPEIYEDPKARMNGIGNTVNAEKEQVEIAKNMIGYETALSVINKKLAMQRFVLSEGMK